MSSQLYEATPVYTGSWVNWSNGRVQGATLTIPAQNSAYLIAFLALFVRVVGSHFWDIFCYILFQIRATEESQDGLYHQEQALLRNSNSDTNASWQFIRLGWYWRKRARRPWSRTLPLALTAFINVVAFGAAGVFVSQITTSVHSDVLLAHARCGTWPDPFQITAVTPSVVLEDGLYDSLTQTWCTVASLFAANCYGYDNITSTNAPNEDCRAYGRRLIDWSVDTIKTCPFVEEVCLGDTFVGMDTGLMDSNENFGINAPPEDRVQLREVLKCAPLTTKGFKSGKLTANEVDPAYLGSVNGPLSASTRYIEYKYGPTDWYGNATFIYSNDSFGTGLVDLINPSYMLDADIWFQQNYDESDLNSIIPQLNRPDADVLLLFLLNNGPTFVEPVNDIWFQALQPTETPVGINSATDIPAPYYVPSEPVTVMGCSQQMQWCNPAKGKDHCTVLQGIAPVSTSDFKEKVMDTLQFNARQKSTFLRMYEALWVNQATNIVTSLSYSMLLAQEVVQQGFGVGLPDNQWILEMSHLFATTLTSMQLEILSFVAGLVNPANDKYLVAPAAEDEWMCSSQIMQRDDYSSFSILGLVLIFVLGAMLIIVNCSLDPIVRYIRNLRDQGPGSFRNAAWRAYDTLHLQTLAYEAGGVSVWQQNQKVPVTQSNEKFSLPPLAVERYKFNAMQDGAQTRLPAMNQKERPDFPERQSTKSGGLGKSGFEANAFDADGLLSGDFMQQELLPSFSDPAPKKAKYHKLAMRDRKSDTVNDEEWSTETTPDVVR